MNAQQFETAKRCKESAEDNSMTFPEIVGQLLQAGFERYAVDFCKGTTTYYLPDGESLTFESAPETTVIPSTFDISAIKAAIAEAQSNAPGYTYKGFKTKVMSAGCVGYVVSFIGQRAVYSGRTAETHIEHFPQH